MSGEVLTLDTVSQIFVTSLDRDLLHEARASLPVAAFYGRAIQ